MRLLHGIAVFLEIVDEFAHVPRDRKLVWNFERLRFGLLPSVAVINLFE
jgi:hypothetical protein